MTLNCIKTGGRGRYRTADRWCVKPNRTVYRVSCGAIASSNAQVSGSFVSTVSTECRAVFACLGTLLAQRGFGRQAFGRVCGADLALRCQKRTIQLHVEPEPLTRTRGAGDVVQAHGGGAPLGCRSSLSRVGDDGGLLAVGKRHLIAGHGWRAASSARGALIGRARYRLLLFRRAGKCGGRFESRCPSKSTLAGCFRTRR
jgi:hypothetical protein